MSEERLRRGERGGGAEEAAAHRLAQAVDTGVVDTLLVEGSVDPGYDVQDVRCEETGRLADLKLETPLVDDRRWS